MAFTPFFIVLISSVLVGSVAAQNCADSPVDMSIALKLMKADILLYGQDVTPEPDCRGDTGTCNYRQITFNVYCILTNTVNAPISPTITIGNRLPEPCDGTFFAYDEMGDELVVMVTYNSTTRTFDWDELVPGESAKFVYVDDLRNIIEEETCAVGEWMVPAGAQAGATCPFTPTNTCPGFVLDDDFIMQYQTDAIGYIGSICCTAVNIGPSFGWLAGTTQSVTSTQLMNRPNVFSVSPDMDPDKKYTLVAYAMKDDRSKVTANWLVVDVDYEDSTFLTGSSSATELIPYVAPVARERNGTSWVFLVYKQNADVDVDIAKYMIPNCVEDCFKLENFVTDTALSPTMMSITVNVIMDSYSLWQLYFEYNHVHVEVCQKWDINIDSYGLFAVCPAPERQDSASSVPVFSALLLALSLICHLPAVMIH